MANEVEMREEGGEEISAAETEVYDRQIRLWGIEAQNTLRHSRVRVVGLRGLGAEVVKNLMLCGLKELQLVDSDPVTADDCFSSFFLSQKDIGKARDSATLPGAAALNPLVQLSIGQESIEGLDLVILCDQPYEKVEKTNIECRSRGIRFISSSVFGWVGYAFFDFNKHFFLLKKEKPAPLVGIDGGADVVVDEKNITTIEEEQFEKKALVYPSFSETLNVDWQSKKLIRKARLLLPASYFPIRAMLRLEEKDELKGEEEADVASLSDAYKKELEACNQSDQPESIYSKKLDYFFGPQLSPSAAVVGGFIGQEAIKALTEGKSPLRNLFLYSALDSTAHICNFPPK